MRASSQFNSRPDRPPLRGGWTAPRRPPPPSSVELHLLRGDGRKSAGRLNLKEIDNLVDECPFPPNVFFVYPSSPVAAKLFFPRWHDALDAVVFFWSRRLDGSHLLTPRVVAGVHPVVYRAKETDRLRALFADHAHDLLKCEAVGQCEKRVEQLLEKIKKLSGLLKRPNGLARLHSLRDERKLLEAEREQLEGRLEEFRAAIGCLVAQLGDRRDGVKDVEVNTGVFNFGEVLDWSRIHSMMVRECRRLDDGLPIYGYRRKFLHDIFSNQVMVLIGETGSGKSTQLVQFLADSGLASGSIICTQPRKIAAISLAQRVGEESSGCYEDHFIISYPTYSSSQGFGSGIIFMTDYCLLQHCMNDMSLKGISYVIVDEAHERSLNTDLLLAVVKKTLLQRFDLRLIIMSATADESKLADYFFGCCNFYVTGRTFPVEIRYVPDITAMASWTPTPKVISGNFASYVSDLIKMVSMIHKAEADGAILAFLTSQIEVEWACENFSDPSAVVLPMHGKLSSDEQSRVFQTYPGKRKVIFATNVAETSLTISGIKYVVDSGMVKDSRFEPSTGMSVLKVGRISQSSANQRSGRAGRTEPGKCYRLYSESDFLSMEVHQEPEIRKVHLGIAALRILSLGIKRLQDFEFVDSPSPKAIETAIENLLHLGAVICKNDMFELTDTGRAFVKLGIEPRLGKIILDSFYFGLKKEGLVLAAVMTNSSSIFCRVGSGEDKYKADCLRLPFCHREGDLFTLLSVYKEWEDEKENQNKWCWQNSINAKSMRRCHDTILELESILRQELHIIIPSYWCWKPHEPTDHDNLLKKVILSSYSENVAMYSGYDRLGYMVASTGQHLQLHPSCSLLVYGEKPRWVVFGEILSVSNQYLVCVTSVPYECLLKFEPPLFNIARLESQKMQMNLITGVGNNLVRRLCGKLNHNLDDITSHARKVCQDDRIGIEIDFDKREIQIYALEKDMEKVSLIVNDVLECEKKWLKDECVEKFLFRGGPECSPSVALFGAGAVIRHLELENRYLTVEISHLNAQGLNDKELLLLFDKNISGLAAYLKFAGSGQDMAYSNKWGKITFLTPEDAEKAVAQLNDVEFCGSLLKVLPVRTGDHKMLPFPAVRAKVFWPRRPSKGAALIKCAPEDAEFIVNDCFALGIGGRYVNCTVSTKFRNCLFVTGLPRDISEPELYDAFLSATERRIFDVHLLRGDALSCPPNYLLEEALVREIAPFMPNKHSPKQNFRVEVFVPETKDYMMKASITFDGRLHLEAAKALDHIQGRVLPGCFSWQKIQCQHIFHSYVSCPARVYSVIQKPLNSLLESFKHQNGSSYNLEENYNGSYRVKITANATKTVADLRKPVEVLMRGKVVTHPGLTPLVTQLLFTRDGIVVLKSVERETGTYIFFDRQNLNVKVFGPPDESASAEEKLVRSLLSLHENKPIEIRLRGRTLPSNLMKDVVQRFGPELHGLSEKVPGVEVSLNTRRHVLFVRGNKQQKQKVEEAVAEVAEFCSGNRREKKQEEEEESSCPICLCEVEEPYKLESCGHDFCRACLMEQFESVVRSRDGFPVRCMKEGCRDEILVVDMRALLLSEKMEELFIASLGAFVGSSDGEYRFCPCPDCPSVYRVGTGRFRCGACGGETCTSCHLEYHPLITCEQYAEYKEDPEQSLREWRKGKEEQVKDCPGCGHTIEKMEGCNHIECRCGRHICWNCLQAFRGSDECYTHLRVVHHAII